MKSNIEFYPHFASADQHPKFKMLRVEFGWSGEGRFWALNNRIAQAENCCLDISKKYNKAAVASDLGFTLPEFDVFIEFLKTECELIQECEKGVITTDIIQEAYERVTKERTGARGRKGKVRQGFGRGSDEKDKSSGELTHIVKERKVKETKNNTIPSNEKQFDSSLISFVENYINYISKTFPNLRPKAKKLLANSCKVVDQLVRIDKFELDYIRKVLLWAQKDEFWSTQIMSLAGIRRKSNNGITKFQNVAVSYGKKEDITNFKDWRPKNER